MNVLQFLRRERIHLTQVDPANEPKNTPELFRMIEKSGTDAIVIAGSKNVTSENLLKTLYDCKDIKLPKIVAPSHPDMVPPEVCKKILPCYTPEPLADALLVYDVLNAEDSRFITGLHKQWYKMFYESSVPIPSKECMQEIGYIPLTHHATLLEVVRTKKEFGIPEVVSWAMVGAKRHPLLYIETTGYESSLTGIEASKYVEECRKFTSLNGYPDLIIISGGGIRSVEEADKRLNAGANAINVGDPLYYEDQPCGHAIYLSTVRGAKPWISLEYHKKLYREVCSKELVSL